MIQIEEYSVFFDFVLIRARIDPLKVQQEILRVVAHLPSGLEWDIPFTKKSEHSHIIYSLESRKQFAEAGGLSDSYPSIEVLFINNEKKIFSAAEFKAEIEGKNDTHKLEREFFSIIQNAKASTVLEIGSRPRKGTIRRTLFQGMEYTGIDIKPGQNVDLAVDAHALSSGLPNQNFSAVYSIYVFEHLAMPWKAAIEMAKVMKIGGHAYVLSHQTYGIHDAPWDFWRFNDTTWPTLFNKKSGFEIVATAFGDPVFMTPRFYRPDWKGSEEILGYCDSAVIVKKIAEPVIDWNVETSEVVKDEYPA
ncbi:MAG: methyltransferase domain-containing protein [Micavibrio sp.]|nr:methyltransferase domain-containing protein [Micavibrio sp.]